ncbi:MAG: alpha/beta hydrolase, partial [Aestuariibacter sp.]|nr:alpha/beta hydrolase [Aestuariibacter sp.]
ETLTLSGMGILADEHVGVTKSVTLGTLALGDNTGLASNYTFTSGTQTLTVTQAALTLGSSDVVKTYDANNNAAGTAVVLSGSLFTDDSISGGTFSFADVNADTNKTVNVSAVTVTDGNGGSNYDVTYSANTTSTINPYVVDLSGSRIYDGTTDAAAADLVIGTLVGVETLTLSGMGILADEHVGVTKSVTLGTLALGDNTGLASNYTFTSGTQT